MLCPCEDDNGVICNRPMSKKEFDQDGMCHRCADLLWETFVKPMWCNDPIKPFVFDTTKA